MRNVVLVRIRRELPKGNTVCPLMTVLRPIVLTSITGLWMVHWLTLAGWLWALALWRRSERGVRGTTLTSARYWLLVAMLSSGLAAAVQVLLPDRISQSSEIKSQFWYWSSVLGTCPFISVLGSRRPTNRVWNGFIVLPLVLVLGWPALTVLVDFPKLHVLEVQTPVVWGFGIVLVMGAGNYLSTRYAGGSLLASAGVIAGLVPMTSFLPAWWPSLNWCLPTLLLALGILRAAQQGRRQVQATTPEDKIWLDFQETFGLVWSARILERVNQTAHQDGWQTVLTPFGFERKAGSPPGEVGEDREKILQTLRWHLRRFVDAAWIDERAAVQPSQREGPFPDGQERA